MMDTRRQPAVGPARHPRLPPGEIWRDCSQLSERLPIGGRPAAGVSEPQKLDVAFALTETTET
jgi:hypothetical protein